MGCKDEAEKVLYIERTTKQWKNDDKEWDMIDARRVYLLNRN